MDVTTNSFGCSTEQVSADLSHNELQSKDEHITSRFLELPVEIQDRILYFTDLICRYRPVNGNENVEDYVPQGIWIRNGRLQMPWSAFFGVNRHLSTLSKRLLFSTGNRLVISGNASLSENWLRKQCPTYLRKINKLDLLLEWDDLHAFRPQSEYDGSWETPDWKDVILENEHERAWSKLVGSIPELFDVFKLHLSIDAAFIHMKLRKTGFRGERLETCNCRVCEPTVEGYRRRYWKIFLPFKTNQACLSKLARFHVFLPLHRDAEFILEKLVMGKDYDPWKDDEKMGYSCRDPRLPHGYFEWQEDDYWYLGFEAMDRLYKQTTFCEDVDRCGFLDWTDRRPIEGIYVEDWSHRGGYPDVTRED